MLPVIFLKYKSDYIFYYSTLFAGSLLPILYIPNPLAYYSWPSQSGPATFLVLSFAMCLWPQYPILQPNWKGVLTKHSISHFHNFFYLFPLLALPFSLSNLWKSCFLFLKYNSSGIEGSLV